MMAINVKVSHMENKLESQKSIVYSQRKIAELLNITFQAQNKYERGHLTPNAKYLQRFIAITRCDPGWLLTGKASEDPTLRVSEAPVGYGFTEEEDEYVKKLVKILRTKKSGTVIAIKQSVDTPSLPHQIKKRLIRWMRKIIHTIHRER